jgi:hypothetical protein
MCELVQMSTRAVFHFVWSLFLLQVEAQPFSRTKRERKAKFFALLVSCRTIPISNYRICLEFFHSVGDSRSQLHYPFAQCGVFR